MTIGCEIFAPPPAINNERSLKLKNKKKRKQSDNKVSLRSFFAGSQSVQTLLSVSHIVLFNTCAKVLNSTEGFERDGERKGAGFIV